MRLPLLQTSVANGMSGYLLFCLTWQSQRFPWSIPLQFDNALEQLLEPGKMLYMCLFSRGSNSGRDKWKKWAGQGMGGEGCFLVVSQQLPSQHLRVFTNSEAPRTWLFQGFCGGFIMWPWLIKSLAISDYSPSLAPLPSLEVGDERQTGEGIEPLSMAWSF